MLVSSPTPMHHRRRTWIPGAGGRDRRIEVIFAALLGVAIALLMVFAPAGHWASPWQVAGLVAAASVASAVRFEAGAGWSSPMQLAQVPLWLAVPPAWFPVFVAISLVVGQAIETQRAGQIAPRWRALLAADDTWHAVGAAVVLAIVGQPEATVDALPLLALVFAGQVGADLVYGVIHGRLAMRAPVGEVTRACLSIAAVDAALLPIGFLAAFAMENQAWLSLSLVPLIGLFAEFAREREERVLQSIELSSAYRGTAQLMASVLRHDDAYTGGEHTRGVVEYALALGEDLELGADSMRTLEFGALLHDIGKIQIPNEIINKPGKLDEHEWAIIREHPALGQRMLDTVGGALTDTGHIVRAHHERFDGTGYPDGLRSFDIPLEARIISVCDSFSAMTTKRPYRGAMTAQDAVAELDRCSGTQFDPHIVDAMHRVLAARGLILTVSRPRTGLGEDGQDQLVA